MDAQSRIQDLADRLTGSGEEVGVQIAAYLDGEPVVRVCAGMADATTGRPVDQRTLFPVAGLIPTVVHVLADRGVLDYGVPVAAYWPEFAAHGKTGITLAHVLAHTAGVPQAPPGIVLDDLADWDGMCARIADLRPLWRPGMATGWHALSFGFILGEVVRRVTGRPLPEVLREEVAAPLGVPDDLFFGVPAADLPRAVRLEDGELMEPSALYPPGSLYHEVVPEWLRANAGLANRPECWMLPGPAGSAATADAVARMFAALIGEVDGVRLVGPATTGRLSEALTVAEDRVTKVPTPKGLGYEVGIASMGNTCAFGRHGVDGLAFADPGRGFAFAYLHSLLSDEPLGNAYRVADEVRLALGLESGLLQAIRRRAVRRAARRLRARAARRRKRVDGWVRDLRSSGT
ncbi:Beta-lactamase [Actinomadura meyerae]|uniref:Beta-lactamase n=1 Tax=Actinomadura meyerae TaxID=240840 RepID=A0A239P2K5_9ACTN|nr:serine hydrolase domain-containing protein [Actinomadura meyerae]SNT61306.1 Beta-lactamase [Actinomadura meyerae]